MPLKSFPHLLQDPRFLYGIKVLAPHTNGGTNIPGGAVYAAGSRNRESEAEHLMALLVPTTASLSGRAPGTAPQGARTLANILSRVLAMSKGESWGKNVNLKPYIMAVSQPSDGHSPTPASESQTPSHTMPAVLSEDGEYIFASGTDESEASSESTVGRFGGPGLLLGVGALAVAGLAVLAARRR